MRPIFAPLLLALLVSPAAAWAQSAPPARPSAPPPAPPPPPPPPPASNGQYLQPLQQPSEPQAGPQAAAPAANAPGVVRLHIDSPLPVQVSALAALERGFVNGYAIEVQEYVMVCMSPCDRVIDGSHGDVFVASGDFPGHKVFRTVGMQGNVEMQVKPGSKGLRALAITLDTLGGVAVITGGTLLAVGLATSSTPTYDDNGNQNGTTGSGLTAPAVGLLVGGAVALVGGIVLGIKTSSTFDLHPQAAAVGARRPRYWAGEF